MIIYNDSKEDDDQPELINVLLVDDHQIVIDGISQCLQSLNSVKVIGSAHNGEEAIQSIKNSRVDIVILDISMPVMDGVEAAKIIKEDFTDVKVIMLTMHSDSDRISDLVDIGVDGYLLKNTGVEELEKAISSVISGKPFYTSEISSKILSIIKKERLGSVVTVTKKEGLSWEDLSNREQQVVELILAEKTSQEIAAELFISHNTVVTHRKNLFKKLQVNNVTGLVKWAIKNIPEAKN